MEPPISRPSQAAREAPRTLERVAKLRDERQDCHSQGRPTVRRLGVPLHADSGAAGRSLTLGAGQVMGSGSCAGCPHGHPGGGKLGLEHLKMQEEKRGPLGQLLAHCLARQ